SGGREAEVAVTVRAAAALPRRDRELDGAHLLRLAAARRTPGEVQAGLADGHPLPLPREDVVALVAPPDVLAARVDELELEIVGPRLAPQPERERVVLGEREREALAHDHPAAADVEVEPDPHARARLVRLAGDPDVRALRRDGGPAREAGEVVEDDALGARRPGAGHVPTHQDGQEM